MAARGYSHVPLIGQHSQQPGPMTTQRTTTLQMPPLSASGSIALPNASSSQHPSSARLSDLLEFVKAEFEQVSGESGLLRAQREEYEAMINHHADELNAMRQMSYDLERKHVDLKNSFEDEIARLRRQIDGLQTDGPRPSVTSLSSLPSSTGISHLNSASTSILPRPNLPSIGGIPGSSSTRPNSSGVHSTASGAPSVGHGPSNLFGGMMPATGGAERGEYPSYQNGDHPNKRMRTEEEDRFGKGKGLAAPPSFPSKLSGPHAGMPPSLSRPNSTTPAGLHHPSPLPPLAGNGNHSTPPISTTPLARTDNASPGMNNKGHSQSSTQPLPAAMTKDGSKESEKEFDPENVTRDSKKEGSDWMTMYNPNVKRVLDVGLVHTLVHDSVVCCVRFSPDGKILATGCNRNTTLYDTKSGARISVLVDESAGVKIDNYIRSASFSPDGKLLATGSEDRIVRIWNIAQKRIWKVFQGHKSEIYSLAFSPDGRQLVSGSGDKTARMWDMESGKCLYTLAIEDITIADNGPVDAGVTSVVLSPDGKFLAAGSLDTVVRIWDAQTGTLLDKLKGHKDSVYSVAFSPDGKFLVSGSLDKTLKIWCVTSLKSVLAGTKSTEEVGEGGKTTCLSTLQGHKDYVLSVDISPDGAWIVSGSKDRGVQFWDPKSGKAQFMLQGHKNSVISVAVADVGGLVATGSGDWSARIWSYQVNA